MEKIGAASRLVSEPNVRASAETALAAETRSATPYVAAAKTAYIYDWNWPRAERYFARAIEIDPADADVRTELAVLLMNMRRFEEAQRHLLQAYATDPLSPFVTAQAGHCLFYQGKMQDAVRWYERLLRLSPTHLFGRWCLAAALEHSANPELARNVINDGLNLHGVTGIPLLVTLCRIYHMSHDLDNAFSVLDQLKQLRADSLLLSHVYARFGEWRLALTCLEEAAERRHYRVSDVNVLPSFRSLAEHTRFESLMRAIGVQQ